MEFLEQVVKLFGFSADTKELSDFLEKNSIPERPKFDAEDGAPMAIVKKEDEGYSLFFGMRSDFEEDFGPTAGDGKLGYMVLNEIRLQGPQNMDGGPVYKGSLPFGLNFSQAIDEVVAILGKPDFIGEPGKKKRVVMWNNFKNLELGSVLSPNDEKYLRYLSLSPVRKTNRS